MSVTELIHLGRSPISKLIVGTGEVSRGLSKGLSSVGFVVTSQLLRHCKAPPPDIFDPSVEESRMPFKDEHGRARRSGAATVTGSTVASRGGSTNQVQVRSASKRGRAAWAHNAFQDYGGLYCDRIALAGGGPSSAAPSSYAVGSGMGFQRAAVLQPHTGLERTGEAIGRVLSAHRHLDSSDVLLLYPTRALPFGGAVLTTLRATERRGLIDPLTQSALLSANDALVEASRYDSSDGSGGGNGENPLEGEEDPEAGLDMSVMSIGIGNSPALSRSGGGGGDGSSSPYSVHVHAHIPTEGLAVLRHALAPRLAYACAYWAANPAKAAQFLASDFAEEEGERGGQSSAHSADRSRSREGGEWDRRPSYPRLCQATLATLRAAHTAAASAALLSANAGTAAGGVNHTAPNLVLGSANVVSPNSSSSAAASAALYASKAMQKPLLSSTDQQILYAYATGQAVSLKSTMNEIGTLNASAKLIEKVRSEGYWTVPNE